MQNNDISKTKYYGSDNNCPLPISADFEVNVKGAQTRLVGPFRTMSDNGSVDTGEDVIGEICNRKYRTMNEKIGLLLRCRKDKGFRQEVPDNDADNIAWLYSWDKGEQSVDI